MTDEKKYKLDPRNYRIHNDKNKKLINKSIKNLGAGRSILVDKDGVIVAGNGVFEQAQKLGVKIREVETDGTELVVVKRTDLATDSKKRQELAVLDNSASDSSEFDFDLLQEDFNVNELADLGIDIESEEPEIEVEEVDIPENPEPKVKLGQIWKLGNHRLMCGSSTDFKHIQTLMNEKEADLLLTDPPYNVDYKAANGNKIENDNMEQNAFISFLTDAFQNANEVLKPGSVFYIWHADGKGFEFTSATNQIGWIIRQCLVWNKNQMVLSRQDYHWKHEPCLYGWKDGAAHFFVNDRTQTTVMDQKLEDLSKTELIEYIKKIDTNSTVIECEKPQRNDAQPTMKPIKLMAKLIKNSSKPGEIVLDIFGGSGSTLIAAQQLNRVCYMMELDPKYCDVIIARWEDLTGEKAELENV